MKSSRLCSLVVALGSLAITAASGQAGAPDKDGFVSLFNGKDFTGWRYYKENLDGMIETADKRFGVEDGVIVARTGKGIKDLFTQRDFPGNFHLKVEFRASLKADS